MQPRERSAQALVIFACTALVAVWACTTPIGGFPDELDHYVRAVAVGRGELYGDPDPRVLRTRRPAEPSCCDAGNPATVHWVLLGTRLVDIPARLAPEHLDCEAAQVRVPFLCGYRVPSTGTVAHRTAMGTIEPAPYLVPGLATRLTTDPDLALLLARLASAALSALLLAVAVLALWPRATEPVAPALAGLVVAVSPMVAFVGASASPSALEVTAGIAFFALLLRAVRGPGVGRRTWAALAATGACLAVSRSLGPVWIVIDLTVVACLTGPRAFVARARAGGTAAVLTLAVLGLASLSTVVWEVRYQPGVPFDATFFRQQLTSSAHQLDRVAEELVGSFGALDVPLPGADLQAWSIGGLVLAALALAAGRLRERLVLVGTGAAFVATTVVLAAAVLRQNGFDVQGRHVLALAVTAPLLAGEIVQRRPHRLPTGLVTAATCVVAVLGACVHLASVLRTGEHYGWIDPVPGSDPWVPPGGAAVWVGLAVLASAALAAGVAMTALGRSGQPGAPPDGD